MRLRVIAMALGTSLACAAPAQAGDPIMSLSQVQRGMSCTAYSVLQGTAVTGFHVDVLDVVASGNSDPRILVRASGPGIEETGIGQGFSGSPIYCADGQGVQRNIGAIAEGVGDYGNKLALATPIESLLGEPVSPPVGTRSAPRLLRSARPLRAPLVVTGLSRGVARALDAASRRSRRLVVPGSAAPSFGFEPEALRPGSAFAVGVASGAVGASSIGTVAYSDGATVWGLGHSLDGVGRRSLLLQDAYVYTVVNNPVGGEELTSYKLAAPGHDLGTLTNDAPNGVVGVGGTLPPLIPLQVGARDGDTGRVQTSTTQIADETGVDQPSGSSALGAVGPLAVASVAENLLRGLPANQTGSMCLRITLRESRRPLGFCNTYVESGSGPGPAGAAIAAVEAGMASDFSDAATLLDAFDPEPLHVTGLSVRMELQRGLRQAVIVSARAPRSVRAGSRLRVRLRIKRRRGPRQTIVLRVRVPSDLRPGRRTLTIAGFPSEEDTSASQTAIPDVVANMSGSAPARPAGDRPASIPELARAIAGIHRRDGVLASFGRAGRPGRRSATGRLIYRDPRLRITGSTQIDIRVKPRRRSQR